MDEQDEKEKKKDPPRTIQQPWFNPNAQFSFPQNQFNPPTQFNQQAQFNPQLQFPHPQQQAQVGGLPQMPAALPYMFPTMPMDPALIQQMLMVQQQQQYVLQQQQLQQQSQKRKSTADGSKSAKKPKKIVYTGDEPEMNPPLKSGMQVWVKSKKFEHWPAQLLDIDQYEELQNYERKPDHLLTRFYGTGEFVYIPQEAISPLLKEHPNYKTRAKHSRAKLFVEAIKQSSQEEEVTEVKPTVSDIKVYNAEGELVEGVPFKQSLKKTASVEDIKMQLLDGPQSNEIIHEHVNFKPIKKIILDATQVSYRKRDKKVKVMKLLGLCSLQTR